MAKKNDNEYIKFFKFYYDKTKNEHPNWTPAQITIIVSMLWKKKKTIKKNPSKPESNSSRRSNKALTAKDAFKDKHRELKKEQLDQIWAGLPKESKNYWKAQGLAYLTISAKSSDVSSVDNSKKP